MDTLTGTAVIAENPHWLLVNKNSGIAVNDEASAPGLLTLLKRELALEQLHPVHRLDKATSGLLLLAKNRNANAELSRQFQAQTVSKAYLALSDRKPRKKQGLIKGDMKKGRNGNWLLLRSMNNPALTRFVSQSLQPGLRLFVLFPQSGKTHQLRVMMKALSAPILGDTRYGGSAAERLYLHATRLAFDWQGERLEFSCLPQGDLWANLQAHDLAQWDIG